MRILLNTLLNGIMKIVYKKKKGDSMASILIFILVASIFIIVLSITCVVSCKIIDTIKNRSTRKYREKKEED